jgi:hypothetical protein
MDDQAIRDQLAVTYLEHLQALAFEISAGMKAIAGNKITRLRDSVAQQEMLCAVIDTMANAIRERIQSCDASKPAFNDPAIARQIRVTAERIRTLNLEYGALLKHSGRTIAVLDSLCRSHRGQVYEMTRTHSKHETWSCEI